MAQKKTQDSVATPPKAFWNAFLVVLVFLALPEFFMEHTSYFGVEGIPFFYIIFGFLSCTVIIVVSKLLGPVLKRKESYYKESK
jgi:hypothetical protein